MVNADFINLKKNPIGNFPPSLGTKYQNTREKNGNVLAFLEEVVLYAPFRLRKEMLFLILILKKGSVRRVDQGKLPVFQSC